MATYRGLPIPDSVSPPDGPGAFLAFAQAIAPRILLGVADLDELATYSASEFESELILVDEMNCFFFASDGGWRQWGVAQFASTGGRDTAYAKASAAYLVAGVYALDSSTGITYRRVSGAWRPWSSDWISFTPSTNITLGTGGSPQNTGEAKFTDGDYRQRGRIVLGTTSPAMPSAPYVGLLSGISLRAPLIANEQIDIGGVTLFDAGVAVNKGWIRYNASNTDRVELLQNAATAAGTAQITSTSPWNWGQGDACEYDFVGKLAA